MKAIIAEQVGNTTYYYRRDNKKYLGWVTENTDELNRTFREITYIYVTEGQKIYETEVYTKDEIPTTRQFHRLKSKRVITMGNKLAKEAYFNKLWEINELLIQDYLRLYQNTQTKYWELTKDLFFKPKAA